LTAEKPEDIWPGVALSYEFVRASFDWSLQRIEAATDRLQNLLTYSATLTFTAPVVAKAINDQADYESLFFIGALAIFLVITLAGLWLRNGVAVDLLSANKLYDDLSGQGEWEFKKNLLSYAGDSQDKNLKRINTLAKRTGYLSVLFAVEVVLLAVWIVETY